MKQVLGLARLRGQTALTNEATLLALLVAWALMQSEVQQARRLPTVSSWTVTTLAVQTLRVLVQGYWTFARLPSLQRFLCSRRRQRDHQESTIRRHFLAHPGLAASDSSLVFFCSSA